MLKVLNKLLFYLLPVPIFIDLASIKIIDSSYVGDGLPLPIGLLLTVVIILLNYRRFLAKEIVISIGFVLFLLLILLAFEFSFSSAAQAVLPIMGLLVIRWIEVPVDLLESACRSFVFICFIFLCYYFIELFSGLGFDYLNSGPFYLYQGYVSFVAVIALYLALVINKPLSASVVISFFILTLMGLLSTRKIFLLDCLTILGVLLFSGKNFFLFVGLFLASIVFDYIFDFGFVERFTQAGEVGDLSSGRWEIYKYYLESIDLISIQFWFGDQFLNRPALHNAFFDAQAKFGFIYVLILIGSFLIAAFNSYKYFWRMDRLPILLTLFFLILSSSFVNANISQPYYLTNLLIVYLYARSKNANLS